jgi:hypothetical protein
VAERAACWESRGDVIGIRSPREVLLVARIAVCWRAREEVVDVARRARNAYVRPGQREPRLVVVELGAVPRRCGVTGGAGRGEVRRNVVRIAGTREVRLVAAVAIGGQRWVVIVDVTLSAGDRHVRARQRERCLAVVKLRTTPGRGAVARRAGGREADHGMRGAICVVEVGLVASEAVGGKRAGVIVVDVALGAVDRHVGACQRELCGVVIKCGACPRGSRMADRAIGRESAGGVRRARGGVEIRLVAGIAIGGRRAEVVVSVALRTGHGCVLARQRPLRINRMIEFRIVPV